MTKIALLAALLLTACAGAGPRPEPVKLDYSHLPRIYLNAQDLRIINRAEATPRYAPYVGHDFTPTLTDALYRLAGDKFQAVGTLGHATLIIKDANLAEQTLGTDTGLGSLFTRQQATKYIGRVEVSLEIQSPRDASMAVASANAVHAVTLPENPSETEKYKAYTYLLDQLIGTLNSQLDQAIQKHMARFLLAQPPASPMNAR